MAQAVDDGVVRRVFVGLAAAEEADQQRIVLAGSVRIVDADTGVGALHACVARTDDVQVLGADTVSEQRRVARDHRNAVAQPVRGVVGVTGLAHHALHDVAGEAQGILHGLDVGVGVEELLAREKGHGRGQDHDEADGHRDHQFDQGDPALRAATALRSASA